MKMNKITISKFFELCLKKSPFTYLGRIAIALYSEPDQCYFITQCDDDGWESIYEDQIDTVYMLNAHEFLILDDNGDTSVVSFS